LVRTCNHCLRTYAGNDPICPYCGFNNGKTQREIEAEKKAELEKIEAFQKKKRRQEVGMQNTFKGLVAIARERGYKAGWLIAQSKVKHIPVDWAEYNRFKREEM
jgi:ribosomal protein L44E